MFREPTILHNQSLLLPPLLRAKFPPASSAINLTPTHMPLSSPSLGEIKNALILHRTDLHTFWQADPCGAHSSPQSATRHERVNSKLQRLAGISEQGIPTARPSPSNDTICSIYNDGYQFDVRPDSFFVCEAQPVPQESGQEAQQILEERAGTTIALPIPGG